ncbi:MAG: hypothetical protein ACJ788_23565 [Ktedonobacteraceae bacterium]
MAKHEIGGPEYILPGLTAYTQTQQGQKPGRPHPTRDRSQGPHPTRATARVAPTIHGLACQGASSIVGASSCGNPVWETGNPGTSPALPKVQPIRLPTPWDTIMKCTKRSRIADHPPRADQSALAAINRALRVAAPIHDSPGISLKFIIGSLWRQVLPLRSPNQGTRAGVKPAPTMDDACFTDRR